MLFLRINALRRSDPGRPADLLRLSVLLVILCGLCDKAVIFLGAHPHPHPSPKLREGSSFPFSIREKGKG